MEATNLNRTIIIIAVVAAFTIRFGVDAVIESSVDDRLVLAGDAVFALALACAAPREPYGVRNEFRWGAEGGETRLGTRRAGAQVGCAVQISVGAWVPAVGRDS
jgi:hypothetical protein